MQATAMKIAVANWTADGHWDNRLGDVGMFNMLCGVRSLLEMGRSSANGEALPKHLAKHLTFGPSLFFTFAVAAHQWER